MGPDLEAARRVVLARYGTAVAGLRWTALGAGGGFSGAAVWRGDDVRGPVLALKAWPPGGMSADRLAGSIHPLVARAAHLPFIPRVLSAVDGRTMAQAEGRVWDVCSWMSGAADFAAEPSASRLSNAMGALAQLHAAWRPSAAALAPPPAVHRRLALLGRWRNSTPPPADSPPLPAGLLRRARAAVAAAVGPAERELRPWASRPVAIRPSLCDVWGAHVLFTGEAVSGLIDFGSAKDDTPAVDLARLLGDLIEDDEARFAAGLNAYRAAGGRLDVPDEFVRTLDRTGAVCGAIHWLLRLGHPDPTAAAARLEKLVRRVEQFGND